MFQMFLRRLAAIPVACFFIVNAATAQETEEKPLMMLSPKDTLLLTVVEGKKFIQHPVKAKQTLFSLGRYYGLGLAEIYDHNPTFRNDPTLNIGTLIKIPVPNRAIKRYKTSGFVSSKNVPIWYVVKDGDNLYQICQRYFDMPVDSIKVRNKMKDNQIKPGQRIHMGWLGIEGIPEEWRPVRSYTRADAMKARYEDEKKRGKEQYAQGICFWQKNSKEKGDLYALHREAPIGSTIQVTNPMFNRVVHAKVIGRIPVGYDQKITLILSPEAAKVLRAKDERFFVKIRFLRS
jgi:LysM repeat protein